MSTSTLTNLLNYLTGTLSPNDMQWISDKLKEYANKDNSLKPFTKEELYDRIKLSEADIAAGRVIDDDDAWDDFDDELVLKEQGELEMA